MKKTKAKFFQEAKPFLGLLGLLVFSFLVMNQHAHWFKASLLEDDYYSFDGTSHVAYFNTTGGKNDQSYAQYGLGDFKEMPLYVSEDFEFSYDDLDWNDANDRRIIEMKQTYSVPYMSDYSLDGAEYDGSHIGVDIRFPNGTPLRALANGRVYVTKSGGGFGNVVVIEHKNVLDLEGNTTTLYSTYAHMNEIFVEKSQYVEVGEIIGTSGNTGTSTTPHLHLQLETADAPFHPYWPFTSAEAAEAGLGYWEAVNAGLGQENGIKYTLNPMEWIYMYEGDFDINVPIPKADESPREPISEPELDEGIVDERFEDPEEAPAPIEVVSPELEERNFYSLELAGQRFIQVNQDQVFEVSLLDAFGETVLDPYFEGKITVQADKDGLIEMDDSLRVSDFFSGASDFRVSGVSKGTTNLEFFYEEDYLGGLEINVIDGIQPFSGFNFVLPKSFRPGESTEVKLIPVDILGNPTPAFYGDGEVKVTLNGEGSLSKESFDSRDFRGGEASFTFMSDESKVSLVAIYSGKSYESDAISVQLYKDLPENHRFFEAAEYLYYDGTITGYPDGSFKPDQAVNRVEALKVIYTKSEFTATSPAPFQDTLNDQWYSPSLNQAYSEGVVQGYGNGVFKPLQEVNRVEFLKMLLVARGLDVDPVVSYEPYGLNKFAWYAPYMAFAQEYDLFPDVHNFDPAAPMTRIEVAEVLYRLEKATNPELMSKLKNR